MPTLTVETVQSEEITFVEVLLEADQPHRIRLEPLFEGPVWPPRANGTAVAGWDEDGVTIEVEAGTTAVGFATPVSLDGGVIEMVRSEPLTGEIPEGIAAWIERIEARVEAAETLGAADDLPSATDAIASAGGLPAVEALTAEIARDRSLVTDLSIVPDDLCERLEAVDVPASTFARIAQGDSPRRS